jgi:hypothetical protein
MFVHTTIFMDKIFKISAEQAAGQASWKVSRQSGGQRDREIKRQTEKKITDRPV